MSKRRPGEPRFSNATIGAVGVLVILALTAGAFMLDALPFVGAGPKYKAYFSEAAGLTDGNEVRVAGVKVGVVTDVDLEGDKVAVGFRAKDAWLGDDTRASIQIKTVLGQKYLALTANLRRGIAAKKSEMAQRRTHHIYRCPQCRQKIRVPRGRGRIEIRCPKCDARFIRNS